MLDPRDRIMDEDRDRIADMMGRALRARGYRGDEGAIPMRDAFEIVCDLVLHQEQRLMHMEREIHNLQATSRPPSFLPNGNTVAQDIKRNLRPGTVVHAARQTGKTTALIEHAAELSKKIGSPIALIGPHRESIKLLMAKHRLRESTHGFHNLRLMTAEEVVDGRHNGLISSVAVDDFWDLKPEIREKLIDDHVIVAAVGTLPPLSVVPIKAETWEDRQHRAKERQQYIPVPRMGGRY